MKPKRWTDASLIAAVATSRSIRQTLIQLDLAPIGGNYATIHRHVKRLNLDTSHWQGQTWNKGRTYAHRLLSEYLTVDGPYIKSFALKDRLIREGLLTNQCSQCALLPVWQSEVLVLHLDHANGNNRDNRLTNLRLLCPNCHSQTDTYCGKKNRH